MIALKEFRYAGKQLAAGDSFDAGEKDVKVLRAIKSARMDTEEPVPVDSTEDQSPSKKRVYKRRDMTAE
ncbi:hypothetical protein A256_27018 [Pseudomonas syringae pv. actinidiae ICMP 19103]|uniref:hypothetical protein n=1 Tax=Pseudomonas syringae TaxID=317 RepID=UPI000358153F|nr:hypothetical protein [Pseudomonas syringae]EPM44254.1 hypothetical protein A256_27018 [Pseudomonas syringae pv. actinidiae ICMP 19103]EPM99978.1 hypothetical protein A253_26770 [Pseudomonas syringae pv. actinidiae ICMP 19102]NVL23215.1 hypothetical protein [Pseudomonas syringae pv. actinidiae]